jgi:hypothetical protein
MEFSGRGRRGELCGGKIILAGRVHSPLGRNELKNLAKLTKTGRNIYIKGTFYFIQESKEGES